MTKAPKRTHLPTVAKWLTNTVQKSNDGKYYHRMLEEDLAIRADVVKELQILVHQAHEDARQKLRKIVGISVSLDPLEEEETPGVDTSIIDDFPRYLEHTTLKGYFGEIMSAVVAENFNPFDEDWQVVAFPFRSHQMAYHALEQVRQEGSVAPTIIGRFGDDMLAFQRDSQNKITYVLFCEAKCTARHDSTLIADAHQKSSDSKIIPVDHFVLIEILQDYATPGSDEESWINSLRHLWLSHKNPIHERCDLVSYICGLPPVRASTVIIPKSKPHEKYTVQRRLEAVEIHLHDVNGLVEEVYQSITKSIKSTLNESELSTLWEKVSFYLPASNKQLIQDNCHLNEWRDPNKIVHSLHQLVSQRVYQLIGGYEDANDSNVLRHDPIYKIACERLPIANQELLASQPTITRMENQVGKTEVAKMRSRMIDGFIAGYKQPPVEIVLDIDGWADPTHGQQQLSCFHGYYGQHMYFPVLINEAESGYPLVLQLRAGNTHSGKGVAGILRWLFWRLKSAFPGVNIILRADAGFSLPEILRVCERSNVGYAIGFTRNAVTERKMAELLERARLQFVQTQHKARLFDDVYYAAATWDAPRRLVMKAGRC